MSTGLSCTCSVAGASRLSWRESSKLNCPALESSNWLGLLCKLRSKLGPQYVVRLPGCATSSCSAEAGGAWLDGHKHLETSPLFVCQPTQSFLQWHLIKL